MALSKIGTSSISAGAVDTAQLAIDAVDSTILDVADNYTYSGNVLVPGHVLKVSGTTLSSTTTYSNNSGENLVMSVAHTALQANSYFYISATIMFGGSSTEEAAHMILKDNTTKILSGADAGSRIGAFASADSGANFNRCQILCNSGLYTGSTHAAGDTKTFNIYFYAPNSGSNYSINRTYSDTDSNFYARTASQLTVMEIAV